MAIGFGVACPKPEPRKRVKARRDRQSAKVVKKVRETCVELASESCQRCGRFVSAFGHAHHRLARSLGGKWTVENIEFLCPRCHNIAHRLKVKS